MARFLLGSLAFLVTLSMVAANVSAQPNQDHASRTSVSLTGAWQREEIDADGDEFTYYFMTNGRFLFYIHQGRTIMVEREGSYKLEGSTLYLTFDSGRKSVIPIQAVSNQTMRWGRADRPENQTTWNRASGDVRLRTRSGDTVILTHPDNK